MFMTMKDMNKQFNTKQNLERESNGKFLTEN